MATIDEEAKKQFSWSLDNFKDYPRNLVYSETYVHTRGRYVEHLSQAETDLVFCPDPSRADVLLRDLPEGNPKFGETRLKSIDDVKAHFSTRNQSGAKEPMCSFYFLQARGGRDPLNITREMLTYILSYEQVMPQFLDYVFTYGYQRYPKDPQFGGLRYENRLCKQSKGLKIVDRGREGRNIQLCYSLKCPESFNSSWAVRQTTLYHSFDIDTGRAAWMTIKGDDGIQKRIIAETEQDENCGAKAFSSPQASFGASFEPHLIVCDWSRENWKWYIKSLEKQVQDLSRPTMFADVPRQVTTPVNKSDANAESPPKFASPIRQFTNVLKESVPSRRTKTTASSPKNADSFQLQPISQPGVTDRLMVALGFSFTDLQTLYSYDEKAKEALAMIQTNIKTIKMLQQYYNKIISSDSLVVTKAYCEFAISRFMNNLDQIIDDLGFQESRLESLLQIIANRKTLLSGMLEYVKTNTSLDLADEAQKTAKQTQDLTVEMNWVAHSTGQSTISMKAITLVTFIFLPGTFISTIMSTDIIRFHENQKFYSSDALKMYLEASLPLMMFSFLFWLAVYQYSSHRDKIQKHKAKLKAKLGMGSDDNV